VDEAHSSQSGETAAELRGVLGATAIREDARAIAEEDELEDYQEEILKAMAKRGRQANMSFFAFTATPKYKTLEVFGQHDKDGKPQPFHLYSMRQAIEEGFILDVLRNYTTYKTYYRLAKAIRDNPTLEKRKAVRALSRFASLHPHNISQKTQLVIEHFRQNIRHKIGGRAKAMLVTSSRLHAVRYKLAFDRYLSEKGYSDIKTLVAFSGVVFDPKTPGVEYTESGMNLDAKGRRIGEKELPERFAGSEYQVLLVADKYQTGFDQPLLHTLYIDKRLSGIQAVQTLSRLNRVYPGKEDTFVLDFVNDPEEILASFQPYYEQTLVGEQAEPAQLHELQGKLLDEKVFFKTEIEEFARIFYKPKRNQTATDSAKITRIIDPVVGRFTALPEEKRNEFKKTLIAFQNLYAFLTQIVPYGDQEMERLYSFTRHLAAKLPAEGGTAPYQFDSEITLKYYRLQKISEGDIALSIGKNEPVSGPLAVGTGREDENPVELSRLIDLLNERFGTEFTSGDQLFFDSIMEDALSDDEICQAAQANTIDNFGFVFHKTLEGFFIDRMEQNENLTAQFLNEAKFREAVSQYMIHDIYKRIRTENVSGIDIPTQAKT
jgi:type I restriction enzyme R subunit